MWLVLCAGLACAVIGTGGFPESLRRLSNRPGPKSLQSGSPIHLTHRSSRYETRIIHANEKFVQADTLTTSNRLPGLVPGDEVSCQVPGRDGAINFWSVVGEVDTEGRIKLIKLHAFKRCNRRCESRDTSCHGAIAYVNGREAMMINLSASGVCLQTNDDLPLGDRVKVKLPDANTVVDGWVLSFEDSSPFEPTGRKMRIRFERPLAGLK